MTDDPVHESKKSRSRRAIASYFRRLADALGRGTPIPADEEQTVTVDLPAESDIEVEVEQEDGQVSLDIELEADEEDVAVDTEAEASKATVEVYRDSAEDWRWRLVHDNGNIIADGSQGYASKQKAMQGLESVRTNAPGAPVLDQSKDDADVEDDASDATVELYEDSAEDWRWRLVHDNGNIIADGGQGYASKQKAKQGLRSVQKNVVGAPVEELD